MPTNKEYIELIRKAQKQKLQLTAESSKRLETLYRDVYKDLMSELETAKGFNKVWLIDYNRVVKQRMDILHDSIYSLEKDSMSKGTDIVTGVQENFFRQVEIKAALKIEKDVWKGLTSLPDDTLNKLINGDLYKDRIGLSKRIWKHTNKTSKDINYILAKGIAQQKPYTEIIKDLDKYLKVGAIKPWDWSTVYPGTNKKVDYNSQRLMRTGINHAFYITSIESAKRNPFVEAVNWELSSEHYVRQVVRFGRDECDDYANQDRYNLGTGNFPKDEVPVPHPQCLCHQTSVIAKSMDEIGKELADWVNGGRNSILDQWYLNL